VRGEWRRRRAACSILRVALNNGIPNHPALPALIVPEAAAPDAAVAAVAAICAANGWDGIWDWTVHDFHHFHPASHEVLTVALGRARLHLGGPDGPVREVSAGDALILPAGFGHGRVSGSQDIRVVGGYPAGQENPEIARRTRGGDRFGPRHTPARPRPGFPRGRADRRDLGSVTDRPSRRGVGKGRAPQRRGRGTNGRMRNR
jgi:uncharacterized protein YjlB